MNAEPNILDVRELIASGVDPFETVVAAYDRLKNGESMVLIAPFRPAPLVSFLERRGGKTAILQEAKGDVRISVTSGARRAPADAKCPVIASNGAMDLRGLEPPEPMVRILEAIETGRPGGKVMAVLSRRPGHLIDMLTRRGLQASLVEQEGEFLLTINLPGGARSADA